MQVFRSYSDINVGILTPNEAQWTLLIGAAKQQPFCAGIIAMARACQNFLSASKRSLGAGYELKNTLAVFEVEETNKTAALGLLDTQAAAYGVAGNTADKLTGVLQHELRAAAVALGYGGQATQLTVTLVNGVGYWDRDGAINTVQQYLIDNDAVWHAPA